MQQSIRNNIFEKLVVLPLTPLKWWLALVGILLSLVWMIVVSLLPLSLGLGEATKFAGYFVFGSLAMLLCVRPLSIWHLGLHGEAPASAGGQANPHFIRVAISTIFAVLVMLLISEVFLQSSEEAANSSMKVFESLGFGQGFSNDVWIILTVTVFAPLGEELLFRGLIMRSLYDGLRNLSSSRLQWLSSPVLALTIAVLVSSFLFADSHGGEGQSVQFYALLAMGIIFALSYAISGSFFAPVMAHSLNNTIALMMIISQLPSNTISTNLQLIVLSGPVIVFVVLLCIRKIFLK